MSRLAFFAISLTAVGAARLPGVIRGHGDALTELKNTSDAEEVQNAREQLAHAEHDEGEYDDDSDYGGWPQDRYIRARNEFYELPSGRFQGFLKRWPRSPLRRLDGPANNLKDIMKRSIADWLEKLDELSSGPFQDWWKEVRGKVNHELTKPRSWLPGPSLNEVDELSSGPLQNFLSDPLKHLPKSPLRRLDGPVDKLKGKVKHELSKPRSRLAGRSLNEVDELSSGPLQNFLSDPLKYWPKSPLRRLDGPVDKLKGKVKHELLKPRSWLPERSLNEVDELSSGPLQNFLSDPLKHWPKSPLRRLDGPVDKLKGKVKHELSKPRSRLAGRSR